MKVLLILTVSCITLTLCHGACFLRTPELVMQDGKFVDPNGCIDPYDKSKHNLESEWNTANCQRCECNSKGELQCCSRYGGIAVAEGCKAVADPDTCTYKFYKADDPSTPCPGM
ncbi:small serum protein 5-like [Heteronotia binoei]|uniref:small serum protein 5-like n=1 Tax=Heteronotia binoei TaxID=13085 RepID=UPI00292EE8DB|nr:small serum protein 5-like [Heteronotia binoei]